MNREKRGGGGGDKKEAEKDEKVFPASTSLETVQARNQLKRTNSQ